VPSPDITRRTAVTAALALAATAASTTDASADPYNPNGASIARAVAEGAPAEGWVEDPNVTPSWDGDLATWNLREIEARQNERDRYVIASLAALRRDLAPTTSTVKIMCVGDSITTGAGSTDGTGYRWWLTDLLAQRHTAPTYNLQAYSGQTLRFVAPLALAALPAAQPNIVLVHLGTNDAMQNDLADWQNRYVAFIDQILASSPTVRVACARIQYGRDTTVASREQQINGYIDNVVAARTAGGRVVSADMTVVPQRWTVDGIHPLDTGYERMAWQWAAAIGAWLPTA
jgi:lysophospholipase L1-like esterase